MDRVYIESSVISYLAARPSRDLVIAGHQAVTAEWWDNHRLRYDVYVSPLLVEEILAGDPSAAEERLRVITHILSVSHFRRGQECFRWIRSRNRKGPRTLTDGCNACDRREMLPG